MRDQWSQPVNRQAFGGQAAIFPAAKGRLLAEDKIAARPAIDRLPTSRTSPMLRMARPASRVRVSSAFRVSSLATIWCAPSAASRSSHLLDCCEDIAGYDR